MADSNSLLQLRDKVQRHLTDEFGSVSVNSDGVFRINAESTAAFISCSDWGDDGETVVRIYSPVLFDFDLTPEVFEYVARENDYTFGSLGLLTGEDDTSPILEFRHTLLGNFLDPQELINATVMVGATANRLDDELRARFGGKRFADLQTGD